MQVRIIAGYPRLRKSSGYPRIPKFGEPLTPGEMRILGILGYPRFEDILCYPQDMSFIS